jgi:hypothetical protein
MTRSIAQVMLELDAAINEYAAAILTGEPPRACADLCKRIKRLARELAKVVRNECKRQVDELPFKDAPADYKAPYATPRERQQQYHADRISDAIAALPIEEVEDV